MCITIGQLLLMILVVWFCVYVIINRICKCFESCMTSKSFQKYLDTLNKEKEENDDNTGSSDENVQ